MVVRVVISAARQTLRSWWALLNWKGGLIIKGTREGEKGVCVGDWSSRGGDIRTAKPVSKEVK